MPGYQGGQKYTRRTILSYQQADEKGGQADRGPKYKMLGWISDMLSRLGNLVKGFSSTITGNRRTLHRGYIRGMRKDLGCVRELVRFAGHWLKKTAGVILPVWATLSIPFVSGIQVPDKETTFPRIALSVLYRRFWRKQACRTDEDRPDPQKIHLSRWV